MVVFPDPAGAETNASRKEPEFAIISERRGRGMYRGPIEGGLSFTAMARRWKPSSVPSALRSFPVIFFLVVGGLANRHTLDTIKK
jgi:hypothetical protein